MGLNSNNDAMRKKQTRKVKKKLRRLEKGKKLKRYMVDAIKDVHFRKHANARKRAVDVSNNFLYFSANDNIKLQVNLL